MNIVQSIAKCLWGGGGPSCVRDNHHTYMLAYHGIFYSAMGILNFGFIQLEFIVEISLGDLKLCVGYSWVKFPINPSPNPIISS